MPARMPAQSPQSDLPEGWQAQLDAERAEMEETTRSINRLARHRAIDQAAGAGVHHETSVGGGVRF